MNKPLLSLALLFAAGLPARADDAKPRPVLEVKIYPLNEANPEMTVEVLNALLGDPNLIIEKAPTAPGLGNVVGGVAPGDVFAPLWRCTVDSRTRTLVFRGTSRHIAIADEVIAVMNRKDGTPMPATKMIQVYALKHISTGEITEVLNGLEFEGLQISTAREAVLLAVSPEPTRKDIAAIVKTLDVPAKP